MTLALRLRLGLRRSSLLYWFVAVAVAATTGLTVSRQVSAASARAASLGGLRTVPVAARAVDAGEVLAAGDVSLRRLPAAAVPDAAVARAPTGRPTLVALAPGEVLLADKLAPDGVRGIAALVPPGMRALAVPVPAGGMALERGHYVDVLATFDTEPADTAPTAGDGAGVEASEATAPTFPVATGALVIDAGEESVTIAVSPDEAPRVAFALARGTVTLALTSYRDRG